MKNLLHSTLIKYFALLMCTLLSACSVTTEKTFDDLISDALRNQAMEEGFEASDQLTPEHYIKLASLSTGEKQQQYLIKAAELLYQRGDISSAQDQLENVKASDVADSRKIQIQLLAAKLALANNNATQAIDLLPETKRMSVSQFIEAGEIRANADIAMGYLMAAIESRIKIDPYYKDEEQISNHIKIWSSLSALPSIILKRSNSKHKTLQGWLELARIMRIAQTDNNQLQNKVLDWGTQFPEHPISNQFITQLLDERLNTNTANQVIAVLLPAQGPYQAVTEAIKSGFLSAYYSDRQQSDKPTIRFYDTSDKSTDFMTLYQRAVDEGANYIVGPLDKTVINQLSQSEPLEVPILTLNYAEDNSNTNDKLYQFGLLPEDEARQVAEQAIRQNKTKAAILVPDTPWGERLKIAFQQRYTELGGVVLSAQSFDDKIDDYSQAIKKMLNLFKSNTRHKDLQRLLATDLKYAPYRRQDIDMIFMAATHRSARGIMPALKFHHAGDLPVFSTSHVYTGNKNISADLDLNGLMFCDAPWILTSNDKLNQSFDKNWPEQKNYTRLFALGIDSYHLVSNLNTLDKYDFARFSGQTGNIYLDENNRLHRELLWSKFRKGIAKYINTTIAPKPTQSIEQDQS